MMATLSLSNKQSEQRRQAEHKQGTTCIALPRFLTGERPNLSLFLLLALFMAGCGPGATAVPTFSPALAPTAEVSLLSAMQTQQAAAAAGTANAAVAEVTRRAAQAQLDAAQFAASATAAQVTANVQATDHALDVQATATSQAFSG
ncbi:MAG: hypothetical protein HY023_09965, partial [Chloroflexi bacterium]|nr:hypothetical protein [Chloroflexota bacterium]